MSPIRNGVYLNLILDCDCSFTNLRNELTRPVMGTIFLVKRKYGKTQLLHKEGTGFVRGIFNHSF